jgi:hypothetical protein
MEKISYEKLSQLQKLIPVALSEPRYAVMKRRAFNQMIKRLYYGKDSRVATSSLSRAYQRLEDRQYIVRSGGRWKLTDSNPDDNGVMLAFLAWAQNRELYARLGLKGPPLEWLSQIQSDEEPDQKGTQELASPIKDTTEARQDKRPGVKTPLDQDYAKLSEP